METSSGYTLLARLKTRLKPRYYSYDPLPSVDHIRILILLPGRFSDKIRCELKTVSRDEAEDSYDAISYVWGDPKDTAKISCAKRQMKVTKNLVDALRVIRDRREPKQLWADAICIDQTDDTEKGHQVKRMGQVYQNAKHVLVWLGRDTEEIAEKCFRSVVEANAYFADEFGHPLGHVFLLSNARNQPSSGFLSWKDFKELFDLPWFQRLWVLQEAGLARSCSLLWGPHKIDFAEVIELSLWLSNLGDCPTDLIVGQVADAFEEVHCRYKNTPTWRNSKPALQRENETIQEKVSYFISALDAGRSFDASDARDRVYAFLGHPLAVQQNGSLIIEPDYSKSVEDVCFETACALLQHPQESRWVLGLVKHKHPADVEGRNVPSWCPRWDQGWVQYPLALPSFWYRAGGPYHLFEAKVGQDKALSISGFVFDRISWRSQRLEHDSFNISHSNSDSTGRIQEPLIDALWNEVLQQISLYRDSLEVEFSICLVKEHPGYRDGFINLNAHREKFDAYRKAAGSHPTSSRECGPNQYDVPSSSAHDFASQLEYLHKLRLAATKADQIGIVPSHTDPGDVCCIFPGMTNPVILRPKENGRYSLVGACYMYGVMRGELMDQLEQGKYKLETIVME